MLYYVKIHGLCCTLNGSFPHAKICKSMHCSSRIYWLTELCRSSKYWHISLHDTKKESRLLISPSIISGKSLSTGKLSSSWWQIQVFQNSNFCLKAWTWSLATNAVQWLKVTGSLYSFLRKCLSDIEVWITIFQLSIFLSSKK